MIAIRLRFPAGRYHANPWGRHVNEGAQEWPPSPYRLLRALYDAWKRKCPGLPESEVAGALGALASSEPEFRLPKAVASHTRSYLSSNTEDPNDKSLVFDGFLAVGRNRNDSCWVFWPELVLSQSQRETLADLLTRLNYLGRSESWIEADLHDSPTGDGFICQPAGVSAEPGEIVSVACVLSPLQYHGEESWLDSLASSTTRFLKSRRSSPPLLRFVRYAIPLNAVVIDPVPQPFRSVPKEQAVILSLDCAVLPLVTATIEIAEQVRVRLMGAHRKRMGGDASLVSPLFSGKDENGAKRLDHGHLFILPLSKDHHRIDRVLLLSRLRPFTRDELDAVRGVRSLWQDDGRPDVRCVVSWHGSLNHPGSASAKVVASATPFVTTRHLRKGRDPNRFFQDEVRRECRNHSIGEPLTVEFLPRPSGDLFECVEFRRNRRDEPPRPGFAFRLTFSAPVTTPFSLGYGCHFGLGLFYPERD